MLTMQPVVLRGRTGLALPEEEFAGRVAAVQAALAQRDLGALVAYGDARSYAPLAWLTGLVPMLKWAVAVLPREGEAELFLAMAGPRDLPAMRRIAVAGSAAAIAALPAALARFDRVAVAGLDAMRAGTETAVRRAVDVVEDAERLLADLMASPSARERELLAATATLAHDAATEALRAYAAGAGVTDALLAGDLSARIAGAHDVRLLWSPDAGRTLRPPGGRVDARPEPLALYLAVECGGYWGEAVRSSGPCRLLPLAPLARMGLAVTEGVEEPLAPGCYSRRGLDPAGAWSSETLEIR